MSIDSAKAFAERLATDEVFRNQVRGAKSDEERQALVQAAGYSFTPEEWQSVASELSEQELEAVAGGVYLEPGSEAARRQSEIARRTGFITASLKGSD
jgi:predicted ribosomally synthesized peptide with nif11-like leader